MKIQAITQKIAIIHNGSTLFQFIDKTLRNTEGYEVISIFDNEDSLTHVLNDTTIDVLLFDLKSDTGFSILLNNKKEGFPKSKLSPREKEVMTLLAKGLKYKEISQTLTITLGTLKQYIHIIYKKLNVSNKTEAINKYFHRLVE